MVGEAATNKENAPPPAQVTAERDGVVGARVRKSFGSRFFWGSVVARYVVSGGAFYKVSFDDGDVDVFAANEVLEDVKLARRYTKEDKLRATPEAGDEAPTTPYQAEMRRPTLKRKRDEPGDAVVRVRLWGQRLYASIYTSDERQTFVKDFLRTEDGQPGELETSGLVEVGDRIIAVNGQLTVGMASWEISDVIRKERRPLWLTFACGDGTREQQERHERMQEQLHRMGPNMPTNGFVTSAPPPAVAPAPRPVNSSQWNSSSQHMGSNALMSAPSYRLALPQAARAQMMVPTYPVAMPPPTNPVGFAPWAPAPPQQGWSVAPVPQFYSVVANPAPQSMHSIQHQATRPRFEVVESAAEAHLDTNTPSSSPPQAPPPHSRHAFSTIPANNSSEAPPEAPPTKTGAEAGSVEAHDDSELDMDDDAAAIAALSGDSPAKEASKASNVPTSFLSPATTSADASAESSSPSTDEPMVEGDNYSIVTIKKPRLYVTLGTLGSHVAVTSFVSDESGEKGEIEESGKVLVGDVIVGVNGVRLGRDMSPSLLAHLVNTTPRPIDMWFERASWDLLVGSK